jgi:hypothetical protein
VQPSYLRSVRPQPRQSLRRSGRVRRPRVLFGLYPQFHSKCWGLPPGSVGPDCSGSKSYTVTEQTGVESHGPSGLIASQGDLRLFAQPPTVSDEKTAQRATNRAQHRAGILNGAGGDFQAPFVIPASHGTGWLCGPVRSAELSFSRLGDSRKSAWILRDSGGATGQGRDLTCGTTGGRLALPASVKI